MTNQEYKENIYNFLIDATRDKILFEDFQLKLDELAKAKNIKDWKKFCNKRSKERKERSDFCEEKNKEYIIKVEFLFQKIKSEEDKSIEERYSKFIGYDYNKKKLERQIFIEGILNAYETYEKAALNPIFSQLLIPAVLLRLLQENLITDLEFDISARLRIPKESLQGKTRFDIANLIKSVIGKNPVYKAFEEIIVGRFLNAKQLAEEGEEQTKIILGRMPLPITIDIEIEANDPNRYYLEVTYNTLRRLLRILPICPDVFVASKLSPENFLLIPMAEFGKSVILRSFIDKVFYDIERYPDFETKYTNASNLRIYSREASANTIWIIEVLLKKLTSYIDKAAKVKVQKEDIGIKTRIHNRFLGKKNHGLLAKIAKSIAPVSDIENTEVESTKQKQLPKINHYIGIKGIISQFSEALELNKDQSATYFKVSFFNINTNTDVNTALEKLAKQASIGYTPLLEKYEQKVDLVQQTKNFYVEKLYFDEKAKAANKPEFKPRNGPGAILGEIIASGFLSCM